MTTKKYTKGSTLLWLAPGKFVSSGSTTPANSVTLVMPSGSFTTGDSISVSGTVIPSGDSIRLVWDQQGTTTPTATGQLVTHTGNNYAATTIAPAAASNWWLWAID